MSADEMLTMQTLILVTLLQSVCILLLQLSFLFGIPTNCLKLEPLRAAAFVGRFFANYCVFVGEPFRPRLNIVSNAQTICPCMTCRRARVASASDSGRLGADVLCCLQPTAAYVQESTKSPARHVKLRPAARPSLRDQGYILELGRRTLKRDNQHAHLTRQKPKQEQKEQRIADLESRPTPFAVCRPT